MAFAESWHVRSRGRECAATQRAFTDGEVIVAALFPDPDSSGYLRKDFCSEGWKARLEEGEKPFSFWKTVFTAPSGTDNPNPVEKLSAEEILQRLVEEDEDHTENARFILAVMLERQKLLRETDSQHTPSGILRVYEHRKTGEVFIVKDPNIPLSRIEEVQNEVFILLENNGRIPDREPAVQTDATPQESSESPEASSDPEAPEAQIEAEEQNEISSPDLSTPPSTSDDEESSSINEELQRTPDAMS